MTALNSIADLLALRRNTLLRLITLVLAGAGERPMNDFVRRNTQTRQNAGKLDGALE